MTCQDSERQSPLSWSVCSILVFSCINKNRAGSILLPWKCRSSVEYFFVFPQAGVAPVVLWGGARMDEDLPAGWVVAVSKSRGKRYYFNRKTGETSWDAPSAEQAPAGVTAASSPPSAPPISLIVCLDTNIVVDHWEELHNLLQNTFSLALLIPDAVIRELDGLKRGATATAQSVRGAVGEESRSPSPRHELLCV